MTKVAFLVYRNLYYKYFGPIIDELLRQNHEVHLIHISSPESLSLKNQKLFYYPQLGCVPQFVTPVRNVVHKKSIELARDYIEKQNIKLVFSLLPKSYYDLEFPKSTRWATVQHGIDSTKYPNQQSDYYICYSQNWLNDCEISEDCKMYEAGVFYAKDDKAGDKKAICQKYGLDPNKRYVLFIPLPTDQWKSYTFLPYSYFKYFTLQKLLSWERKLLAYLHQAFEKQGIEMIIKSRFKRFLPASYSNYGHIVYDETFYPSTITEVAAITEHCFVNFMPSAVSTEVAAKGKGMTFIHYPWLDGPVFNHIHQKMQEVFIPDSLENCAVFYRDLEQVADYKSKQGNISQRFIENYIYPKQMMELQEVLEDITKSI